jgi:hypothetical protein
VLAPNTLSERGEGCFIAMFTGTDAGAMLRRFDDEA